MKLIYTKGWTYYEKYFFNPRRFLEPFFIAGDLTLCVILLPTPYKSNLMQLYYHWIIKTNCDIKLRQPPKNKSLQP